MKTVIVIVALAALIAAVGVVLVERAVTPALGQEKYFYPDGQWRPSECCANSGWCRPLSAEDVEAGPDGWLIRPTGETVSYGEDKERGSRDGRFHRCSVAGNLSSPVTCLFVPGMGS